ncbi:MAG: transcriptional regulator NrdR [Candidatus Omnitrophica bacterium]|nr:transcriptional regulator NrdR [Candidatus Omnitrophota bacterium]MCM8808936.1 transcriptional regulator NrdR [Candidatus Omnitrophota bacterium]MCM8810117.1 transcriptional regulator NrdR [Candidatus Omnitrophota bacterium]MCM8833463.1 transcriptional regulator NrdR [Candidatus Omnitrophota bacterium]
MKCPYCGYLKDKVLDSREREDGMTIRRRRMCLKCKRRFTTYEEIELKPLIVVKKDGRREKFNRDKLRIGIQKACEKRPISTDKINEIVENIEKELRQKYENEVKSKEIGKHVIKELKKLDKVAYIRFASVYQEFENIEQFLKEIEKIGGKNV